MSKSNRVKKSTYRVFIGARWALVEARTPGAAVHRARKILQVQTETDHSTGGWKGVAWQIL